MSRIGTSLRNRSENYHMLIHVLCGFICAYITIDYFPEVSHTKLNIIGVLGSLSPDIDHVMYWFFYGKKSQYSQIVRNFLRQRQFKNLSKFLKLNHKTLTGLYFHNFLTLFLSISLCLYYGFVREHPLLLVFFMSWSLHYIFDLSEDLLFFKRINPNWYFRFNKVTRDLRYVD
jgi:hypothetical protein